MLRGRNWLSRLGSLYRISQDVPRANKLVAEAIRALSKYTQTEYQYLHTGWIIDENNRRCFLTTSGAMARLRRWGGGVGVAGCRLA